MASKLSLLLDKKSGAPQYEQISRGIRKAINNGELTPGQQLPSVRELAKELSVSIMTVRKAIEDLVSQGLVDVVAGSGTFVSQNKNRLAPRPSGDLNAENLRKLMLEASKDPSEKDSELAPGTFSQRVQKTFDHTRIYARYDEPVDIDFRVGAPPLEFMAGNRWEKSLARWAPDEVLDNDAGSDIQGLFELRNSIASWLRKSRGIECDADNLIVVGGGQQARNLIARSFINPGTRVAMEDPGSIFARLMFQSYGAEILPVPVDESGVLMEPLEKAGDFELLYLTPSAQFPSGAVLSANRRRHIAEMIKKRNILLIEDDNHCEYAYESRVVPAVCSLAPENTLYFGTFSQTMKPSWRIGYLLVPQRMREAFCQMKWLMDRCVSPIVQELVYAIMEKDQFARDLKKARGVCEDRRAVLLDELSKFPFDLARYSPVKGGLHQTIWLSAQLDDVQIVESCFQKGVGLLPVSPCFLTAPAYPGLILNFSALSDDSIRRGLKVILEVLEAAHGS